MDIFFKLNKICETKQNVCLKSLCSIHIGGVGDYVCYPSSIKQLKKIIKFVNKAKIKYYVIGNGTNIIFEDCGFSGVIICLRKMCASKVKGTIIYAEAGLNLFALNYICKTEGLGGLEWSYGIPASVGGAVCMNAGAYNYEMKDFIKDVWILKNGKVKKIANTKMGFEYRTSAIKNSVHVVLKASFKLKKEDSLKIEEKQKQIFAYRKCCQPYGTYNSGSIFKKTDGISAGKTIDKLGLKNVKIGDIQISPIHANFFINLQNGKSEDLHKLINFVKCEAKQKEGVILEEEVIFVGNKKD